MKRPPNARRLAELEHELTQLRSILALGASGMRRARVESIQRRIRELEHAVAQERGE